MHAHAGHAVDAVHEVGRQGLDDLHLAGEQGGYAGGGLGHHAEDHGLEGGGAAPVGVVTLEHGLRVEGAAHERERSTADGVRHEAGHADFLDVRLGHDLEVREGLQHQFLREGVVVNEPDGVVVDLLHVADGAEEASARAGGAVDGAFGEDALECEHHVVGGEGGAVMERNVVAQVELVGQLVDHAPGGGQVWLHHAFAGGEGERVEDVTQHGLRLAVAVHSGVHGNESVGAHAYNDAVGAGHGDVVHALGVVRGGSPALHGVGGGLNVLKHVAEHPGHVR